MFSRKHFVVSLKHVNPLYIKSLEQIHRCDGSPKAIPSKPDLLSCPESEVHFIEFRTERDARISNSL